MAEEKIRCVTEKSIDKIEGKHMKMAPIPKSRPRPPANTHQV
jgi:hypothetical protein